GNHLGVPACDVIHHPADGFLVAWNLARREHDDISWRQLDVPVVVDGNPRQRRLRFTLRAGADTHDILGRKAAYIAVPCEYARRNAKVSQALGNLRVVDGPAPDERHPAIELRREI